MRTNRRTGEPANRRHACASFGISNPWNFAPRQLPTIGSPRLRVSASIRFPVSPAPRLSGSPPRPLAVSPIREAKPC